MSGVLVLAEASQEELSPRSFELLGAGLALAAEGAGPLTVALIGAGAKRHVQAVSIPGVAEVIVLGSELERFEAHVYEVALAALIEDRRPAVVLLAHTLDSLGFAPAVAARGRLGFASEGTWVAWREGALLARRGAYDGRALAELDFPERQTVLLTLRPGAFTPVERGAAGNDPLPSSSMGVDGNRARTRRLELRAPATAAVDIAKADLLVSIGRGVGTAERIPQLEELARLMDGTLAASGPLVEAGWVSPALKVGQSGRAVAPRIYLALGISGAPQHLAGIARSTTIIAVNSDPAARIFDFATYGAVADLFAVAAELERRFS